MDPDKTQGEKMKKLMFWLTKFWKQVLEDAFVLEAQG